MTHSRRVSQCIMHMPQLPIPLNPSVVEEWVKAWSGVFARGMRPFGFWIRVCSDDGCRPD